ncbi:MAG: LLM class flavin-dependent oxidoreductase [Acidimicrobiales bacterium]|nr:LLM class flavin-dependent oxidoreductase [Acidimicrobiaceae bacterium]MXV87508.1 LLM class flavin-dependent oxidoreductase [Acidimicrobiales bacterium]MXX43329.1 LLM class flavin-dependent oxidoreductase [Acidimicrobiales bacterium]MXY02146.1 LLM class flavin-dependent oxidoreductase [Acidimicrobiales bacterium]MYB82523.1 LLM class flavin-dependent oxidoreductase [Acidimicrobiales bacterium]
MAQPLRFGVVHDLRSPPGSEVSLPEMYAQALDQLEMADELGFELAWFTEHHFLDDGHLPNFVPVAGAVAARTSRIRISTDILLAPFVHPIRLAEDLAVLDNISGGRIELGIGMGYAAHEFRGFGIPQSRRVSLTEELVQIRAAERYRAGVYARLFDETPDEFTAFDPSKGAIPQGWIVGDEDHCTAELTAFIAQYGVTDLCTWGGPPGLAPSIMNDSLQRLARNVIPRVRASIEDGADGGVG